MKPADAVPYSSQKNGVYGTVSAGFRLMGLQLVA